MPDQETQKKSESRLPAYLTALAAFVAAMMPLTAFVNGLYSIEVEQARFVKQLQLNYIDRALDTSRDPTYRESFLRFIVDTTDSSDPLHKWASREIDKVSELAKLRQELASLNSLQRSTSAQLAKERDLRSRDRAEMSRREQELAAQLAKLNQDRLMLESTMHVAELRSGVASAVPNREKESDVDRVLAEFRQKPGVEEFISNCVQQEGEFHYRYGSGAVQQLVCNLRTGGTLIFGEPQSLTELGRP